MYPFIEFAGHKLSSYHLCAALAGIIGWALSVLYLRKKNRGAWAVCLPVLVAAAALVGARLLNRVTNPRAFSGDDPVWALSYGRLSLMGGLIAGVIVLIVYCLLRKEKLAVLADAFTVPAAAGILLLKLGCFLNGCCHGKPTDGPFGMVFPANAVKYSFINSLKTVSAKSPLVHPTQLYEIAGAVIALTAAATLPRILKLKEGSRAAIFAALFSVARWIVLPLRELPYDRQIVTTVYPCLYAACICCAVLFFLLRSFAGSRKKQPDGTKNEEYPSRK